MKHVVELVPDRICGQCSACCVTLRIDEPPVQKPADIPCVHLGATGGCSIHATRPSICRTWFCGWRFMRNLGDEWRPDLSKVLIRLQRGAAYGLVLQPLADPFDVLMSEPVMGLVAGCISGKVEISISVPTRPGFNSALLGLNGPLAQAVATGSLQGLRSKMNEVIRHAQRLETAPLDPAPPH